MSNIVLTLPKETIEQVISFYKSHQIERKGTGVRFASKMNNASITIYNSGKVMFQGAGAEQEAKRWGTVTKSTAVKDVKSKGDRLPANFRTLSVLGSDETGTGDYFGPITVAAVYVPAEKIELLKELGVKDSKMLTDAVMLKLAPDLMKCVDYSILTLKNPKYNELQARGMSQGKLKALLHNQALKHVLKKIAPEHPDHILIDQFAERPIYFNHIKNEKEIVRKNVLFATKAEQLHVAVAAASILARYAFLIEMDRLSEVAGVALQKGASAKVDEMAAKILLKKGEAFLQSITKWHFANTQKARKIADKKKS